MARDLTMFPDDFTADIVQVCVLLHDSSIPQVAVSVVDISGMTVKIRGDGMIIQANKNVMNSLIRAFKLQIDRNEGSN